MAYCLHPDIAKKFQAAVKDGTFTPDKYRDQPDSEARRAFLENIIGQDDAKHVNALLESKLLLNPPNPPRESAAHPSGAFTKLHGLTGLKGLKGLSALP